MDDWLSKLEREFLDKREREAAEAQRQFNHDQFISSQSSRAWEELMARVNEACQRLSSRAGARMKFMPGGQNGFTISGGSAPLDVSFDLRTKRIDWVLHDTPKGGTLKPDRQGDELVYRTNGEILSSPEEAAAFLLRQVF